MAYMLQYLVLYLGQLFGTFRTFIPFSLVIPMPVKVVADVSSALKVAAEGQTAKTGCSHASA